MLLPLQEMLVDKHGIMEVSARAETQCLCIPAHSGSGSSKTLHEL